MEKRDSLREKASVMKNTGIYTRIYRVVKRIPKGRVATYGQVASLAGMAGHARQVGYALYALPEGTEIPWHRVINAKGMISSRSEPVSEEKQRLLLEAEGICFNEEKRLRFNRYRWHPGAKKAGLKNPTAIELVCFSD